MKSVLTLSIVILLSAVLGNPVSMPEPVTPATKAVHSVATSLGLQSSVAKAAASLQDKIARKKRRVEKTKQKIAQTGNAKKKQKLQQKLAKLEANLAKFEAKLAAKGAGKAKK